MMKFEKKNKMTDQRNKLPQKQSSFGNSLFMKGELKGEEDVVIEGQFQGKIDLRNHNLIVELGGKAKADIQVKNITINGEVTGNVYASGKVFIAKEGQMKGDIIAPRISIVDGAQFKGSVKMDEEVDKTLPLKEKIDLLTEEKKYQGKKPSPPEKSPE